MQFPLFSVVLLSTLCLTTILCNNYPSVHLFLKASKNVPRIGRNTNDFGKYFLKSSKNEPSQMNKGAMELREILKNVQKKSSDPLWSGMANVYEWESDLQTPEIKLQTTDDSNGNYDNLRYDFD